MYQVLSAQADPIARDLLHQGCNLLHERAAQISSPILRQALLENIPSHRELLLCEQEAKTSPEVHEPLAMTKAHKSLTPREIEILQLIFDGLSNQEIADRLFLTVSTVKRHISNIYRKLGVHSRSQAIKQAREIGLF